MKVLFIGGTGNISTAVSRLAVTKGMELYLLNRGLRNVDIPGVKTIIGDIDDANMQRELSKHTWDCVVNWIAYTPDQVERDIALFQRRTKQYIFISSASAYQKPLSCPVVTESTPLYNPFWEYSRNKIRIEDILTQAYRETGFPITIVRPSYTYDTVIPIAIGGFTDYTVANRILNGKKIIVHGDGKSLWTNTHADDFAKGFVGLIGNDRAVGHPFHITSDEILTWDQIYTSVAEALGREANIVHIASETICKMDSAYIGPLLGDKAESAIFDNSKIKSFVPGFVATIPFKEGIRGTMEWFDAHPEKKIINQQEDELFDRMIAAVEKLGI